MKPSINVYDFCDPVSMLEAFFKSAKDSSPELSVRQWASAIGFQSSDTLLKILTRKKDITPVLIEEISKSLNFDSTESNFFGFMVKYSQAKNLREKNLYEVVMKELAGPKGTRIEINDEDLFSHWSNLAILSFCNLKTNCTRKNLKSYFIEDVSQDLIEQSIDKLLQLGLLSEDTEGRLHRLYNHESSRNDQPMQSVRNYYRQVFDIGKKRVDFPVDEREFQTALLAIKRDQLPVIKDLIRSFKAKLAELSQVKEGEQVYHLNIQFFPMSKSIDEKEFIIKQNIEETIPL